MHRSGHGTCKAAAVVARGHAPGVLGGVELHIGDDLRGLQAEDVGHHLGAHRHVALTGWRGRDGHIHSAEQVDGHCGTGDGAILRACFGTLLRGEHRADVAHIGNGGFDNRRHPDAVQQPTLAGLRLSLLQPLGLCSPLSHLSQAVVVTRVEHRSGRSGVGELVVPYVVAKAQRDGVLVCLNRHPVHQPFECKVHLWATKAAYQSCGGFVAHHHPVAHL